MKTIIIQGIKREDTGTNRARKWRREGFVPGVIYGKQKRKRLPIHFALPIGEMRRIVQARTCFVEVTVEEDTYTTIVQDKQTHPVSDSYTHLDLFAVSPSQVIKMDIPIILKGKALGVTKGGLAVQKMRSVRVKASVEQMPDQIEVDITELDLGKTLRVNNMPVGDYSLLVNPTNAVVMIEIPRIMRSNKTKAEQDATTSDN